jgi:hypothetical protein
MFSLNFHELERYTVLAFLNYHNQYSIAFIFFMHANEFSPVEMYFVSQIKMLSLQHLKKIRSPLHWVLWCDSELEVENTAL